MQLDPRYDSLATKPPQFTSEQRQRLREEYDLLPEQIQELEKILLICQAELRNPAKMADVRSSLETTEKSLEQTLSAISRLLLGSTTADTEARTRLLLAEFEANEGVTSGLETALQVLTAVQESARMALAVLPSEQRRDRRANPAPIGHIERALLRGFCNHHYEPREEGGVIVRQAAPPYMLRTARNKLPFPQVVAICYEAIGSLDTHGGGTPDRAIREYLRLKKEARSWRSKNAAPGHETT